MQAYTRWEGSVAELTWVRLKRETDPHYFARLGRSHFACRGTIVVGGIIGTVNG